MKRTKRKLLSGVLAAVLLLQTALPTTVFAAESAPKTIVGFSVPGQSEYSLPIGADEAAANALLETLPKTITADVEYIVTEEIPPVVDSGEPEQLPEQPATPPTEEKPTVPDNSVSGNTTENPDVATDSNAAKDEEIISDDASVRALGVSSTDDNSLPETTLTQKTVSEQVELAVTWASDKPMTTEKADSFTYTAVLSDDDKGKYDLAAGVTLPTITVTVAAPLGALAPRAATTIPVATADEFCNAFSTTAQDGDIIQVTDNIDLGTTGAQYSNKTVTLDLNGKTVTYSNSSNITAAIKLLTGASLSVIDSSGKSGKLESTGAGNVIHNIATGTINVSGVAVSANFGYAIANDKGIVTVSNAAVSATNDGTAIYNKGTVTVTGGTVSATSGYAIQNVNAGAVAVENAAVSAETGYAIYNSDIGTVNVSGGTVSATEGCAIYNYATGKITVSGDAKVTSATVSTNANSMKGTIHLKDAPTPSTVILEIKDTATVSNSVGDYSVYFESPKVIGDTISSYYKKDEGATVGKIYPETFGEIVEINGKKYTNFGTAAAAVKTGETMKILDSFDLGNIGVRIDGAKAVTLDLNGKTVTYSGRSNQSGAIVLADSASLTVTDSSGGSGDLRAMKDGHTIYHSSTGTLTVTGGTVSADMSIPIVNASTGAVTVSGGTVLSRATFADGTWIQMGTAIHNYDTGKITISGTAKVTASSPKTDRGTITVMNSPNNPMILLDIQGGTVENTDPAGYAVCYNAKVVTSDNLSQYFSASETAKVGRVYPVLPKEGTPAATFTAAGVDSGTLSGLTAGKRYQYSLDGGTNYTDFTGETATIAGGITTATGVWVVAKGNVTTTVDSEPQKIAVTKASAPTGLATTDCTTAANNDGTITGVTTAMEYKLSTASAYTSIGGTTVTGLAPGTYHVRVKAADTVLTGPDTAVTVRAIPTTGDLTYSIAAVNYDGSPKAVSVTAKSGKNLGAITVKYAGNTTAPTNAGTYAVTVDIAASAEYAAAIGLNLGNLTINRIAYTGAKTVTASVLDEGQTGATVTLPVLPTGASYGTPVASGTITMSAMSLSGTTLTYTAPASTTGQTGTITIPVTGATNYADYDVVVTITSTDKLPQNISYATANATKTYGDAVFTNELTKATVNGAITYASGNAAVAAVNENTGAVTITGAGTTTITATAAATATHAEATASYTLTVNKKGIIVKADDKSAYVGDAQPALTYTVTGLVGSETLKTVPTLACTSDMSKAGSYPITASGAAVPDGGNYNETITYTSGTLTVSTKSTGGGDSSGGGGGGGGTTTPPTGETVTNPDGSTTTTTTDKATGTVTETTKNPDGSKEVSTSTETKQPDGSTIKTETTVTTDKTGKTTGAAATVVSDSASGAVKVPAKVIETLSKTENATLNIETPKATLTLDGAALKALAAKGGKAPEVTITPVAAGKLPQAAQAKLKDSTVYDFNVNGGGMDFAGGTVTISLDYARKNSNTVVVVYFVNDKGEMTKIPGSSFKNGKVSFPTGHFSYYAVAEETMPFTDVSVDSYYADAVLWAVDKGVTSGTSATNFAPDSTCTRAQAVTFLWRAIGSPAPIGNSNPFTDVSADSYYYSAVLWAAEQGVTGGTSADKFSPNATVSRAQVVTFLHRAAKSPVVNYAMRFTDVSGDAYYAAAVRWAVSEGITGGTSQNTFGPGGTCTRAQIVTFLYRCFGK